MSTVCCLICKEERCIKGFSHHYLYKHNKHLSNYDNCNTSSSIEKMKKNLSITRSNKTNQSRTDYLKIPSHCKNCNTILDYKIRKNVFCSRSCAATFTNKNRNIDTKKKIEKIKQSWIKKRLSKPMDPSYQHIVGEYTRIYLCTCKYSGVQWYSKTRKRIHPDLATSKKDYAYSCQFDFAISDFPKWFHNASDLIKEYGWYSTPGSRKGTKNLNGISRDHLYSITDGWKNNISPQIIRHPANCNLIPHSENQKKNKKSNITLSELYERIALFEKEELS